MTTIMGGASPYFDAVMRNRPGYKPQVGPRSWNYMGFTDPKYDFLGQIVKNLGGMFGGAAGGAGGGAMGGGGGIPNEFNFNDLSGNRMGGVGPSGADLGISQPNVWNPGIAGRARSDLMGAAGYGQQPGGGGYNAPGGPWEPQAIGSSGGVGFGGPRIDIARYGAQPGEVGYVPPAYRGGGQQPGGTTGPIRPPLGGGPPRPEDVAFQGEDASTAAALQSANALNMAGLPAQAGMDLQSQQARAGLGQNALGLMNQAYGLQAGGALQQGALGLGRAGFGRDLLMQLLRYAGPANLNPASQGMPAVQQLAEGWQPFGWGGVRPMQPLFPM